MNGSASLGADFSSDISEVLFQSGQSEVSMVIQINNDDMLEHNEVFIARLTSPDGKLSDAVITIHDDEGMCNQ